MPVFLANNCSSDFHLLIRETCHWIVVKMSSLAVI
jgi:hypothetical protein